MNSAFSNGARETVSGRPSGPREPRAGGRRARSPCGRRGEPPHAHSPRRARGRVRSALDARQPRTHPRGRRAHGADARRARSRHDRREGLPRARSPRRAHGHARDAADVAGMSPLHSSPWIQTTTHFAAAASNVLLFFHLRGRGCHREHTSASRPITRRAIGNDYRRYIRESISPVPVCTVHTGIHSVVRIAEPSDPYEERRRMRRTARSAAHAAGRPTGVTTHKPSRVTRSRPER